MTFDINPCKDKTETIGYIGFEFDFFITFKSKIPTNAELKIAYKNSKRKNKKGEAGKLFDTHVDRTNSFTLTPYNKCKVKNQYSFDFKRDGNRIEFQDSKPFKLVGNEFEEFKSDLKAFFDELYCISRQKNSKYFNTIKKKYLSNFDRHKVMKYAAPFGTTKALFHPFIGKFMYSSMPDGKPLSEQMKNYYDLKGKYYIMFWWPTPIFVLNTGKNYFRRDVKFYCSPQCNITVPLSRINNLITLIKESKRKKIKLSGFKSSHRNGIKSDSLFDAQDIINLELQKLNLVKNVSDNLKGFLVLILQYLLISKKIDSRDYEVFAKAYIPLNVKTSFQKIFWCILSSRDRKMYNDHFGDDVLIIDLAKRAKSDPLFPPKTIGIQNDLIAIRILKNKKGHIVKQGAFTCEDFLTYIVNREYRILRTKRNPSGNNQMEEFNLFAALVGKPLGPFKDLKNDNLIVVELRRIGYRPWEYKELGGLMDNLFKITKKLNS